MPLRSVQKSRCLTIFENSIQSEETKKNYLLMLDKYRKFAGVGDFDELLKADSRSIQRLLEDYVISLKGKISPNTFNTQLAPVFLFYELNEITLNKTRLKKMYPAKVKRGGYGSYSLEDIKNMLSSTRKKRTKACILILSSTGCRATALCELNQKDVENYKDGCKIITFYSNDTSEYVGFLTQESSKALDDYTEERIQAHERITLDSPLIRESYSMGSLPAKRIKPAMLQEMVGMTLSDVKRKKDTLKRYNIAITGGFRKFFNLTMKLNEKANISLVEKLMGHSVTVGLDNYYLPASTEKLFGEFQKNIPNLTISDSERLRVDKELQAKKIQELESDKKRISELEANMKHIQDLLEDKSSS